MLKRNIKLLATALLLFAAIGYVVWHFKSKNLELAAENFTNITDSDEEAPVPTPVAASPQEVQNQAHDTSALGGYNVLIADRGNNRLIEVTPDKQIVWEYDFNLPKKGLGADDSFFTDGGKNVIVNLEEYHTIEIIDYATKQVVWSYGHPGQPGSGDGYLNTPDDAYKLANGNVITADIKNCRVIEISPDKKIVRQYGVTGQCLNKAGYLDSPNGDTPIAGGHILISNIRSHSLTELDSNWQPVATLNFPIAYPSDPQLMKNGDILISDYVTPGKILEENRQGQVVWEFEGDGTTKLDKPSLAIELPNGNILSNDDLNHRVIVIDKQTKKIIWQYGVTGKPGRMAGQLSIPDGVDIIPSDHLVSASPQSVGSVSRHAENYQDKVVTISGYVLQNTGSFVIVSDEPAGSVGHYDLPVAGLGAEKLAVGKKYILTGILVYKGLQAPNQNDYHLELVVPPQ